MKENAIRFRLVDTLFIAMNNLHIRINYIPKAAAVKLIIREILLNSAYASTYEVFLTSHEDIGSLINHYNECIPRRERLIEDAHTYIRLFKFIVSFPSISHQIHRTKSNDDNCSKHFDNQNGTLIAPY